MFGGTGCGRRPADLDRLDVNDADDLAWPS